MFGTKLKVRPELLDQVKEYAARLNCTVEEFVEKSIEREIQRLESEQSPSNSQPSATDVDEIMGKLKGLGYID